MSDAPEDSKTSVYQTIKQSMKYKKLTGIVLKKQNYREADQIVTLWTREAGKVRVMARGLRHGKSKLSYSMQDLSLVDFETAGNRSLPSLVAAKSTKNFINLRDDLSKTVAAFYATELMLKMTADEQPNSDAYELLLSFLEHLNSSMPVQVQPYSIVDSFSLKLLASLGFSFENAQTSMSLPSHLGHALEVLSGCEYSAMPQMDEVAARQSHSIVKNFIESILERNIRTEQFLISI